jgi:hypothetical protein
LFQLIAIVGVESSDCIFYFFLEQFPKGLSHLKGSALEVGDKEVVALGIRDVANCVFLAVGDLFDELGLLIDGGEVVLDEVAGQG